MIYYTNEKAREEIDELLKENARLEATLGKDSTPLEKETIRRKQNSLFNCIKKIDSEFYEVIVIDSKRNLDDIHNDINHSC